MAIKIYKEGNSVRFINETQGTDVIIPPNVLDANNVNNTDVIYINYRNTSAQLFKGLYSDITDSLGAPYGANANDTIIALASVINFNASADSLNTRLTTLENNEYIVTYFEIEDISAGTSGSVTIPTGAAIQKNTFGESGNSVASTTISPAFVIPTFKTPLKGGTTPITVNLATNGSYTTNDTYPDPIAVIYTLKISAANYSNLDTSKILDFFDADDEGVGAETRDKAYSLISTSTYSILSTDEVIGIDCSLNTVQLTLPQISGLSGTKTYKYNLRHEDGNANTNNITILPFAGDTIQGGTAGILIKTNSPTIGLSLYSDGSSNWLVYADKLK
jgi:hypothetical protein